MLFFFRTLVKWRKFIIAAGVLTAIVTAAISLVLPQWYTATSSIFPPETQDGMPSFAALIQSMQVPLLGPSASGARPETIYIDILKSRRIGEKVIEEFNLMEVYDLKVMEIALGELHSHMGFNLLENGLLIISFEARDPDRAAAIANRLVSLLDEFNTELNVTRASRTKEFIEKQITSREISLTAAETELRQFKEAQQALELDEQLRTALEIVGELTGDAIALETQLEIMRHYTSTTSEEYVRKKTEYDEVLVQLAKLKVNGDPSDKDLIRAYLPTLGEVPELALQMLRLERKVEIETAIYTMLVKEYEKTRIEEARDTPTIQVMDTAVVPNLRSRPKRKMLVVIGALVGFGWSALLAVFVTAWRENGQTSRAFTEVLNPVFSDFSRVFRRK